ncbi:MAG: PASTA domain-containing protein, partial [Tissierellia bacterium]|nr:PASTA domain-containing protein [Tissierellia bacterium]
KLVISKGEENTLIPMINVVGLNVDDATSALTNKNISWNISYDYSEETEKDIVMSQSVNAEVEIDVNTIVELIVSKGPKEVEDTNDEEDPKDVSEEDTETDDQEQEEVPVPDKSFTISFYVPEEKSQSNVKLVRILDGIRSVAYEKVYSAGDGDVYITLESEKVGTIIELYIDEQLTESWTVE